MFETRKQKYLWMIVWKDVLTDINMCVCSCLPLSMISNSFSSPVILGIRVQGSFTLVHTAYTWEGKTSLQRIILSKSPSLIFFPPALRKLEGQRAFISNFSKQPDQYTFLLHHIMKAQVCRRVSASICVTSLLWSLRGCVGRAREASPWIRRGRRRSGRCTSAGSFWRARGHRMTDRWAGRWSWARPVGTHKVLI